MPSEITTAQILSWFVAAAPYITWVTLFGYLLVGGILDYHWRRYGVGIVRLSGLRIAYVICGIVLFGVLFVAMSAL